MSSFEIKGGCHLKGEITPQGAKNEALQILCAVLLTPEKVTIRNIPDILDVNKLMEVLGDLGVRIQKLDQQTYTFQADDIDIEVLKKNRFRKKVARQSSL